MRVSPEVRSRSGRDQVEIRSRSPWSKRMAAPLYHNLHSTRTHTRVAAAHPHTRSRVSGEADPLFTAVQSRVTRAQSSRQEAVAGLATHTLGVSNHSRPDGAAAARAGRDESTYSQLHCSQLDYSQQVAMKARDEAAAEKGQSAGGGGGGGGVCDAAGACGHAREHEAALLQLLEPLPVGAGGWRRRRPVFRFLRGARLCLGGRRRLESRTTSTPRGACAGATSFFLWKFLFFFCRCSTRSLAPARRRRSRRPRESCWQRLSRSTTRRCVACLRDHSR